MLTESKESKESLQTNTIQNDTVASLIFVMSDDAGEVLDLATRDNPMRYMHGHRQILPGLEKALDGKSVRARFHVDVAPEEDYKIRKDEPQDVTK